MNEPSRSVATVVTGAAGFIAFHVITRLLREGIDVIGVDNFDPFYDREVKEANLREIEALARELGRSFTFVEADLCELDATLGGTTRWSVVVHLAAKAGVRPSLADPEGYARANIMGTLRLLEVCRERHVDAILFGSSSSVYGDATEVPFSESARADRPISPYAASKRAGELYCSTYCHLYGLRIIALRFFTVYGPKQRPDLAIHKFTRRIANGETIELYGDGASERDYTWIDDIVEGVWAAWTRVQTNPCGSFEVINLGGSATTSLKEMVANIEKHLGTSAEIEWLPPQPGDVRRTWADLKRAEKLLGFSPKTPFAVGIARFVRWFIGSSRASVQTKS